MPRIGSIVEGHGECLALPILIRRVAQTLDPGLVPEVRPLVRVPASKLRKEGELERHIDLVARRIPGRSGVLVLLDADDGCPATDAPALLARGRRARPDLRISVVLAKREFESWFLAAAESLRGRRGLPLDLTAPRDPESIRGAKEWLEDRMPEGRGYIETIDQPALAALFDLAAARRADSFDKCYREITSLIADLRGS